MLMPVLLLLSMTLDPASARWSNRSEQQMYMRRAIQLAIDTTAAQSRYAALIVDPSCGEVLAQGSNHAAQDPIWHGEMAAIANLSRILKPRNVSVYTAAPSLELYTTAEPCPMCMSAIVWSGFGRVVYGTSIPYIESQGHEQIGIRAAQVLGALQTTRIEWLVVQVAQATTKNVSVVGGVLAQETNKLYRNISQLHPPNHSHPLSALLIQQLVN